MKYSKRNILLHISYCLCIVFLLLAVQESLQIRLQYKSDLDTTERTAILLDISRSMNIRDIEWSKSRIDTAKSMIESHIESSNHSVWLSIFAWEWVNILPFNTNNTLTITTLKWLNDQSLHLQWSRLDSWVRASIALFWDIPWGNLIIFTDQDSYEWGDFFSELQMLQNTLQSLDIQITLVWVGSHEWGKLETWIDRLWQTQYLTYRWEIVRAPLEEDFLREVSQALWGNYINYRDFETGNTSWEKDISNIYNFWITIIYTFISLLSFVITLALLHKIYFRNFKKIIS